MLRIPITSDGTTGKIRLNMVATIIEADSLVTNGIIHVLDRVVPRNTRLLPEELQRIPEFSIFSEALQMTGLADSLRRTRKDVEYTITDRNDNNSSRDPLYVPYDNLIMYTVFAETDSVMRLNGINNIDDLIAYANRVYGDAANWYDYPVEKGITISTGTDYTNRFNTLNMFVAYHLLFAGMPVDQLLYENNEK